MWQKSVLTAFLGPSYPKYAFTNHRIWYTRRWFRWSTASTFMFLPVRNFSLSSSRILLSLFRPLLTAFDKSGWPPHQGVGFLHSSTVAQNTLSSANLCLHESCLSAFVLYGMRQSIQFNNFYARRTCWHFIKCELSCCLYYL